MTIISRYDVNWQPPPRKKNDVRIGGLYTVTPDIQEGIQRIVKESKNKPNPMASTDDLVKFVLGSLVDGYDRSGSWERTMLEKMGLI